MTTVSHASLTGADLHEPKGAASAASGTVYVANGLGSGTWTTLSALTGEVGEIKAFATPLVPAGFLECDGTAVSRTTYASLFSALTIQQTGSRNNGTPVITGLSDTSSMKAGYFVGGSGITNGTTILSVDSGTQITLSANATSTGSSTVIVSPWAQGNGTTTFTLPAFTDTGRFPRSRTSSTVLGSYQSNLIKNHTHPFTTDPGGAATITSSGQSVHHTHNTSTSSASGLISPSVSGSANPQYGNYGTITSGNESVDHTHNVTLSDHTHGGTTNNNTSGGTETRPEAVAVIWCVRY